MPGGEAAEEYHSKDFEWDQLRQEIEADPSLRYHLLPLHVNADDDDANSNGPSSSSQSLSGSSSSPSHDSEAWNKFHARHSSGKFFKTTCVGTPQQNGVAECKKRHLAEVARSLLFTANVPKHFWGETVITATYLINRLSSSVLQFLSGETIFAEGIPRTVVFGKESITVYSCDCCHEALERAQEMIDAADLVNVKQRFHPFLCDFSISGFPKWLACEHCREFILQKKDILLPDVKDKIVVAGLNGFSSMEERSCCLGGVDFVTLIFTLSAVPLHRMPAAIAACFSVLKPGGLLLFRDYGLYDMTMLRFEPDKKVGFREYIRSDGTRSYFFCLDTVRDLLVHAGFNELELEYCCVKSVNRRKGKIMQRVWVHGKFQKSM